MMLKEFFFEESNTLTDTLTNRIGDILEDACKQRGNATFIASGGSSPKEIYHRLNQRNLPWQNINITLTDERWVANDDPDSNEAMVRQTLLANSASTAKFVSLYAKDKSIDIALDEIEARLNTLTLPSDCVLLGMGLDGHTASLFPNAENLVTAIDLDSSNLCYPMTAPGLTQTRITLTAPALLNTRQIILLIIGEEKRTVYENAKNGSDNLLMPVRVLLNQKNIPVEVYWCP